MKYENSSATGYKGMKIPYTLYGKTDSAKDLMILLPGAAYTVKSPVFHYLSGLFFNRSTDILEVNYSYQDEFYEDFSSEEKVTAVKMDAHAVIDEILRTNSYENYSIIGKSIGTFAMSTLLNREVFKRSKVVWMTPILTEDEVFRTIASAHQEGFCVIGDEDRFYKKRCWTNWRSVITSGQESYQESTIILM